MIHILLYKVPLFHTNALTAVLYNIGLWELLCEANGIYLFSSDVQPDLRDISDVDSDTNLYWSVWGQLVLGIALVIISISINILP